MEKRTKSIDGKYVQLLRRGNQVKTILLKLKPLRRKIKLNLVVKFVHFQLTFEGRRLTLTLNNYLN